MLNQTPNMIRQTITKAAMFFAPVFIILLAIQLYIYQKEENTESRIIFESESKNIELHKKYLLANYSEAAADLLVLSTKWNS